MPPKTKKKVTKTFINLCFSFFYSSCCLTHTFSLFSTFNPQQSMPTHIRHRHAYLPTNLKHIYIHSNSTTFSTYTSNYLCVILKKNSHYLSRQVCCISCSPPPTTTCLDEPPLPAFRPPVMVLTALLVDCERLDEVDRNKKPRPPPPPRMPPSISCAPLPLRPRRRERRAVSRSWTFTSKAKICRTWPSFCMASCAFCVSRVRFMCS